MSRTREATAKSYICKVCGAYNCGLGSICYKGKLGYCCDHSQDDPTTEELIEKWARPESFRAGISTVDLDEGGSSHVLKLMVERGQMRHYLDLMGMVERAAQKMAANMLKGILKYGGDGETRSAESWMEYAKDDATDTLNYMYLLEARLEKDKAAADEARTCVWGPLGACKIHDTHDF